MRALLRTALPAFLALALASVAPALGSCAGGAAPGGIHARMAYSEEGGLRVVDAPPSGPAARAGLREGDRIMAIDGEPVRSMTMTEVVERLRGPAGTKVLLEVAREGARLDIEIPREPYREGPG